MKEIIINLSCSYVNPDRKTLYSLYEYLLKNLKENVGF